MSQRKSLIGSDPKVAKAPPDHPGKPWWTSPPTVAPLPEWLEYAKRYRLELVAAIERSQKKPRELESLRALIAHVNAWIKAANYLLCSAEVGPDGLRTDDQLFAAGVRLMAKYIGQLRELGKDPCPDNEDDLAVWHALRRRQRAALDAIRRNRHRYTDARKLG